MNVNYRNDFFEITQANATLSGYNDKIPSEMASLRKIMATLAQQVSTMEMTNNKSDSIGILKIHTSVAYHFPWNTVGHTDRARTVTNNAP